MSYLDQANLADDATFQRRLAAALANESAAKADDDLADLVLRSPTQGANMFMPVIAAAPGFAGQFATDGQEAIDDGELLSAIQANWSRIAGLYPMTPPVA
jgi:hypothetical protein